MRELPALAALVLRFPSGQILRVRIFAGLTGLLLLLFTVLGLMAGRLLLRTVIHTDILLSLVLSYP
jgi:hypothetical protein